MNMLTRLLTPALFAFSLSAHAAAPVPTLGEVQFTDPGLQACVERWTSIYYSLETPVNEVKELSCAGRGITSLAGVEVFTELLAIDLANNPIEDYSPLYPLARYLSFVHLYGNEISCEQVRALKKNLPRAWLSSVAIDGQTCDVETVPNEAKL